MFFGRFIFIYLHLLECWKSEPNERPNIQEVVSTLKSISLNNINQVKENYPLVLYNSDSANKEVTDINNDLIIDNIPNNNGIEGIMDLQTYERDIMEFEDNLSSISNQIIESSTNIFDYINKMVVDKLIEIIIEKHNRGIVFDQIQQFINQQILQWNQDIDDLIKWLKRNQSKAQYIWFLGLFYYYNIDTEDNNSNAFQLFLKASKVNYS